MEKKPRGLEPLDVKDYLVKGDRFTKWTEESTRTTPVTMKMDPKGYYLYWTNQNRETEFLDVATIRDTRCGKYAKLPKHPKVRNVFNMDFPDSNHLAKVLTIVSGPDTVNLTYHNFFASKEKVVQNWADDILAIAYNTLRNNACRQVFLDKVFVRISLQTNKDGKIPVKNIYKMFPSDKKRVESALASANLPKGKGDTMKPEVFKESAFKSFLMNLCPRPEIYEIFTSYSARGKPYMTKENLIKFLNEKQRDSRLNEELFPPLRPDQVKALIEKYEPSTSNSSRGNISPEGLLYYLMGPDTSVVTLGKLARHQDMTQPLPHYFIKSSHNTYLTAGQFSGVSSPEMYRQCLLAGCRCLELDCWKGKPPDEEPIITHGFTMTTEILFKDVIEAIAESAFKTSPYPVILSFENHVDSVKQQEKMANYCKTIFGEALLIDPLEKYPLEPGRQIPSPSELMGKILIKNKKNSSPQKQSQSAVKKTAEPDQQEQTDQTDQQDQQDQQQAPSEPAPQEGQDGEVQEDQEETEGGDDEQDEEKMKNSDEGTAGQEVTAYEEMSALVNYIQPNKFISFENARKKNRSYAVSSFVETKANDLITKNAVEFVEYNKRQMSRIYPKGTRMDSSNYNPQPFWTAGCQMVALNYQTMDFPMQLNLAVFEYNGRTGYLLKHDVMRRSDKKFDLFTDRIDTIVANTLSIKIYSGQFLSDKNVKTGVEVELIGLPGDPKRKYKTKWSATANAINPVWNEEPFVFEKILLPEMASLRMVAYDESGKFLGQRIIPIDAIQSGFHHICLRSESNIPLTLPALFVYIEVTDYIPAAFADFSDALFNPTKFSDKPAKTSEPEVYLSPYEMPLPPNSGPVVEKTEPPSTQPAPEALPETQASSSSVEEACVQNGLPASENDTPNSEEAPSQDALVTKSDDSPVEPPVVGNSTTTDDSSEKAPPPDLKGNSGKEDPPQNVDPTPTDSPSSNLDTTSDEKTTSNLPQKTDDNSTAEMKPNPDEESKPDVDASQDVPPGNSTQEVSSAPAEGLTQTADTEAAVELPANTDTDLTPSSEAPAASEDKDEAPPEDSVLEPSTVTAEELKQHKSFLKLTKRQEKDMKELEKKNQKKGEELVQKYSDMFKSLKKKNSVKKKDSDKVDPGPVKEKITELKTKLHADLNGLRTEQYELLKKKKEQHATEQLAKLLEMAKEKHAGEAKALREARDSETKEMKKKLDTKSASSNKSGSEKGRSQKDANKGQTEDFEQMSKELQESYTARQQALEKKQAATVEQIKQQNNKLNEQAMLEHQNKMRSLPKEVHDAANTCIGEHFPDEVDQTPPAQEEGGVFVG
ncbi:1-phosphatidylinositol 4,5-bisphosphate phosphodiesterase beta-2 isoform X3 [Arapaima gigas]